MVVAAAAAACVACFDLVQIIVPLAHGSWRYPLGQEAGLVVHTVTVVDAWDTLLDIVAWEPAHPEAWWRWTRQASYLTDPTWLGSSWLELPLARGPPPAIRLVESPAHWLRDRGEAVCVLDWSLDLTSLFWGLRLVPESPRLKRRLDKALAAMPAVVVL